MEKLFEDIFRAILVGGVIVGLVIAGLIWGGVSLYKNYNVKVEKVNTPTVTNVVTITNYVK